MTQKIKERLEQAAAAKYTLVTEQNYWIAGAQTILENPKEWGLMPILDSMDHIEESDQNWSEVVEDLKSQLTKYREALDKIVNQFEDFDPTPYREVVMYKIAKEALKQEVNND